jgi:hypothetical protein
MKTIKVSEQNHKRLANLVRFDLPMDGVIGMLLDAHDKDKVKRAKT